MSELVERVVSIIGLACMAYAFFFSRPKKASFEQELSALRLRAQAENEPGCHVVLHLLHAAYVQDLGSRRANLGRHGNTLELAAKLRNVEVRKETRQ